MNDYAYLIQNSILFGYGFIFKLLNLNYSFVFNKKKNWISGFIY